MTVRTVTTNSPPNTTAGCWLHPEPRFQGMIVAQHWSTWFLGFQVISCVSTTSSIAFSLNFMLGPTHRLPGQQTEQHSEHSSSNQPYWSQWISQSLSPAR